MAEYKESYVKAALGNISKAKAELMYSKTYLESAKAKSASLETNEGNTITTDIDRYLTNVNSLIDSCDKLYSNVNSKNTTFVKEIEEAAKKAEEAKNDAENTDLEPHPTPTPDAAS